mmetsp:Transcript_3841/g.8079  ORF Transcript_3841/g.8079 Transcript_3841/m.8079 type:complete len:105 (-) Transcript_3841:80-394(-)
MRGFAARIFGHCVDEGWVHLLWQKNRFDLADRTSRRHVMPMGSTRSDILLCSYYRNYDGPKFLVSKVVDQDPLDSSPPQENESFLQLLINASRTAVANRGGQAG